MNNILLQGSAIKKEGLRLAKRVINARDEMNGWSDGVMEWMNMKNVYVLFTGGLSHNGRA